jgi:hypothetical protein
MENYEEDQQTYWVAKELIVDLEGLPVLHTDLTIDEYKELGYSDSVFSSGILTGRNVVGVRIVKIN